jgi:DNA polymerase-3 subunit epsilon
MERYVFLDVETTGFSHAKGDKVLEIGCVEVVNRIITKNEFHFYINPQRDIPADSTNVHGITAERVANEPIFEKIAQEFIDFIGEDTLVAHNSSFDIGFLNYELGFAGYNIDLNKHNKVIDSLVVARSKYAGARNSLDALCKRFEIDITSREKHGALLDSQLLAKVYLLMTGGQSSFDLASSSQGAKSSSKSQIQASKMVSAVVSEEDIEKNKNIINQIT